MKDVQCYELFGGIAHKNHAFSSMVSLKPNINTKSVDHFLPLSCTAHVAPRIDLKKYNVTLS